MPHIARLTASLFRPPLSGRSINPYRRAFRAIRCPRHRGPPRNRRPCARLLKVVTSATSIWFRLKHPIVAGEAPSVYQRVAVAADSGNGISAVLDLRLCRAGRARHAEFVRA